MGEAQTHRQAPFQEWGTDGQVGPIYLQLLQQLCGGTRGTPRGRTILGVQAGVELCQGLADGVGLFLELRLVGSQEQSPPTLKPSYRQTARCLHHWAPHPGSGA